MKIYLKEIGEVEVFLYGNRMKIVTQSKVAQDLVFGKIDNNKVLAQKLENNAISIPICFDETGLAKVNPCEYLKSIGLPVKSSFLKNIVIWFRESVQQKMQSKFFP